MVIFGKRLRRREAANGLMFVLSYCKSMFLYVDFLSWRFSFICGVVSNGFLILQIFTSWLLAQTAVCR